MSTLAPGTVLACVDSAPDRGAVVVEFEHDGARLSVILARRGDAIAAFRNRCPHAGYPLQRADGRIVVQEGRYMVCAAHGASYALETGACAGGPCNGAGLESIPIEVRDGVVRVARPAR